MIKQLRRRHLQIWLALALLLPLGIISARLVIPNPVLDHLLQPTSSAGLPFILKTIEKDNYTISLRSSTDKSFLQLEWINKSVLTAPSAIIYKTNSTDSLAESSEIIGRIGERGIYHFPLKIDSTNDQFHFVLYDVIHHKIIDQINF